MWSVIGEVLIGVLVIGVVTALALLGGPIRYAAVGKRAKNLRTPVGDLIEHGEPHRRSFLGRASPVVPDGGLPTGTTGHKWPTESEHGATRTVRISPPQRTTTAGLAHDQVHGPVPRDRTA
jgi:hypothetical protein